MNKISKHELILKELKFLASNPDVSRITTGQFDTIARKLGMVRSDRIKEHLLTCIAQGYLVQKSAGSQIFILCKEVIKSAEAV